MRTEYRVNDMTIHRLVEQEQGFIPMLEFLPALQKEVLEANLSWLAPGGYNPGHEANDHKHRKNQKAADGRNGLFVVLAAAGLIHEIDSDRKFACGMRNSDNNQKGKYGC